MHTQMPPAERENYFVAARRRQQQEQYGSFVPTSQQAKIFSTTQFRSSSSQLKSQKWLRVMLTWSIFTFLVYGAAVGLRTYYSYLVNYHFAGSHKCDLCWTLWVDVGVQAFGIVTAIIGIVAATAESPKLTSLFSTMCWVSAALLGAGTIYSIVLIALDVVDANKWAYPLLFYAAPVFILIPLLVTCGLSSRSYILALDKEEQLLLSNPSAVSTTTIGSLPGDYNYFASTSHTTNAPV